MNNEASLLNCTYNVHLSTGLRWMTGREVIREFGWEDFHSDYVMHSEWCELDHGVSMVPEGIWTDPFGMVGNPVEPPF